MADMWADLLPVLLVMMISPARTLAVIILLHTPRRAVTSLAYVSGMVAAMMVQGAALGLGMRFVGITDIGEAAALETFIGALFLVGGVLLLVGAARMARPTGTSGALATALEKLESAGPRAGATVGFGWIFASPKQWVFTLTAVSIIYAAYLTPIQAIGTYLIYSVIVQLVYFVIIGVYALVPDRIDGVLNATFGFLKANLRTVAVALFASFGIVFIIKAISILGT